ncbi:MAG: S41 family peptidase [Prevotellaceae bacterium]|jgi:carboxyl-terminal processing protease|nr:S41 family peptidase [Prevotellaceae bacterium]
MKKNFFIAALLVALPCSMHAQSDDFKVAKSIDLYFSVLRELSLYYVDSIQLENLVNVSIEAMLKELDPYTEYVSAEDADAFDFAITGAYGGIGAIIRKHNDGIEISEPYRDYPADKAGLVPGDCILEIEGQSTKNMDVQTASNQLKGPLGNIITLTVRKLKTGDTIRLPLTRERIHISDVDYYGILKDSIGYIHLNAFTKGGSRDVAEAFKALKKTKKMKSLIFDLRSNGGGALDEAVNITGLFVPRGTTVVEARGRLKDFDARYVTKETPLDTDIPIVVLVNNMSASSSEIVTGAIQDLDRGVIVGTRTFGKGLVQSVRDIGFNAKLKITTAKYYTPSGRCVQIVDYSHRREDGSVGNIPDSLIKAFKTRNGRTVYDGGGITPDIVIETPAYHKISYLLATRGLFRSYAILYSTTHERIAPPETFRLTDKEYEAFLQYLSGKDFDDKDAELTTYKSEVQELLEQEICSIYYYQEGSLRNELPRDEQVSKALEVLGNKAEYRKILNR